MSTETRLSPGPAAGRSARRVPVALAAVAVGLQISYPLLGGSVRDAVTVAVVAAFAAANVAHAAVTRGTLFAGAMLVVTAGLGFAIEVIGVHTGLPFGRYAYGTGLGPTWAAVPPLVAFAWVMLAWPAAMAARTLASGLVGRVLVGAWALAATDLFLDPQMVRAGYWTWADRSPHLPGVASVPLSNYGGWLLTALVVSAILQVLLGSRDRSTGSPAGSDRLPVLLYLWLCIGWVVALACFLGLVAAAAWGALAVAPVVLAVLARLRIGAP